MEQELPTLPEHLNIPNLSGVWFRSLFIFHGYCFVQHYLSFCPCSYGNCIACPLITTFFLGVADRLVNKQIDLLQQSVDVKINTDISIQI
jgi:hypothetical protein